MEVEEWRDVVGFDKYYQVSSIGRVRSCRYGNKILKPSFYRPNKQGIPYHKVTLCVNRSRIHWPIARLVAMAFHANPLNKPQVDHINRNPSDNRSCNLRWATNVENSVNKLTRNPLGFKGVQKHSKCSKYQAHIGINGHSTYIGLFDTIEEAHAAYMRKAKELHGEFVVN